MTLPLVSSPLTRIGLIGECMVELRTQADGQLAQAFGGDTLNAAVYLRRLLEDGEVQVDYLTAVGDDTLSQAMRARWREEGVSDERVRVLPGRLPGLYLIQTDADGERRFLYWRGEAAARECFDGADAQPLLTALAGYQVLYLSGISLAVLTDTGRERLFAALREARAAGTRLVFDNNYRPRLWPGVQAARTAYQRLLQLTDLALVTWEDDAALFGFADEAALFAQYAEWGVAEVALKRGARSCLVQDRQGRQEVHGEAVARVVDTTAAGDSFSAAYLACRLQGGAPDVAARWGHRLAATVIQHPGALIPRAAMPAMPPLSLSLTAQA
ncbi:2-dehydro-3-deoxygluconokinase [Pseudomonas oryzihabitans]|uniref:2-dehydro-3-deoxygluconokinase n=1 Tax=Pseudomonas oryzihabitans TaxID=47885 RepID=A0A0U4WAI5_9PSED|nr:sugar kinase [Pseudomonas oryzihabitans]ALZ84981.1 2-dehydro-3-deoxygluconokinase [Pseudomonas oryzihabitans]